MNRCFLVLAICALTLPVHALTYTVTNNNNLGPGSLFQAVLDANANAGADVIAFNIPGAGVHTITLGGQLLVTETVDINGYTQPGSSVNNSLNGLNTVLQIELDCASAAFAAIQFAGPATGSTVRGVAIGNCQAGVTIDTSDVTVTGNYLGTDATGTSARSNDIGIVLNPVASEAHIGIAGDPAARNLISGNGFGIFGFNSNDNLVTGNLIGTNAAGTAALSNQNGVVLSGTGNNIASNLVSGNVMNGITIAGAAIDTEIFGNAIGTNINGTGPLPNATGIRVAEFPGVPQNTAIVNNIISFNAGVGIVVTGAAIGTRIDDNEITDNGGLGIDLGEDGVTLNDALDADTGPNALQNFPVITSAVATGPAIMNIAGTLQSLPNTTFNVQLFIDSSCDESGHGEGFASLGQVTVVTNAAGSGTFNTTLPTSSTVGVVTGTATEVASGSTSEFSACRAIVVAQAATPIPTLTEIGLTGFAAAIALLAFLRLR